jgi:hypothetical protein
MTTVLSPCALGEKPAVADSDTACAIIVREYAARLPEFPTTADTNLAATYRLTVWVDIDTFALGVYHEVESSPAYPEVASSPTPPQAETTPPWGVLPGRRISVAMIDLALFLAKVYRLSREDEHKAVDAVYDFMDDLLLDGNFLASDEALSWADPQKLTLAVAISFLIVTRRAEGNLPGRAKFLACAEAAFAKGNEAAEIKRALRNYR